jgi:glutaredoxin 3
MCRRGTGSDRPRRKAKTALFVLGSLALAGLAAGGLTHAWRSYRATAPPETQAAAGNEPAKSMFERAKSMFHVPALPSLTPPTEPTAGPRPDPFAGPAMPANFSSQSDMERYIDRQSAAQARQQSTEGAKRRVHVTLYATKSCGECGRARAWLRDNEVTYFERDIEADPAARRKMTLINDRGTVPTLDVEGDVLLGFDEGAVKTAIARASQHHVGER